MCPGNRTQLGKGLEYQERLRELEKGLSLEKERLRGDLVSLHNSLTGGGQPEGGRDPGHSQGTRDGTTGNYLFPTREDLDWLLGKSSITESEALDRLPRAVVESLSLERFKMCSCGSLGCGSVVGLAALDSIVGLNNLKGIFPPKQFYFMLLRKL